MCAKNSLTCRKSKAEEEPMNARLFRCLALSALLLLTLCSACSLHRGGPTPDLGGGKSDSGDKAVRLWQRYTARAAAAEGMTGPFRVAANLRYTAASGESTRVSSLLWGNGKADSPYPLRLDLLAGVGTVVAKIREDSGDFVAFSPEEKTAYTHARDDRTLVSFGVPIPLTLGDLTLLLTGQGGRLFLPTGIRTDSGVPPEHHLTENGADYLINNAPLPGILELSDTGAPVAWREQRRDGWSIEMEPGDENPLQPRKLRISHPKGYSALIVVKEISRVSPPYTAAQMDLVLPPGTATKPLER